ncbi:hypothetical protein [Marinoscillum sp.]|uniref:hypothetical protein n=1 Tax=Marinoscillum sp. TaxID=2024838 RepID=UPI003BAAE26A
MKNSIRIALSLCLVMVGLTASAQDFLSPSFAFSHSETAYLTLTDGSELECTVDKIKRKKGLIKYIRVEVDGVERELSPAEVSSMYLPPNALDQMSKAADFLSDANKWTNEKLDQDLLNQGLVYFEQAEVQIKKKKTMTMLMQLLNPSFSGGVKVYHDPFAKESASVGVGGIKVAGGNAKSYFVLKGDGPAVNFEKKKYKKVYEEFWSDCEPVLNAERTGWGNFNEHVFQYDQECAK